MFLSKGRNMYIKQPEYNELDFVQWLWADNETMCAVGGPVCLDDSEKEAWYKRMVDPTDGNNFYCLIYNNEDKPVGEVSFHRYDCLNGTAEFNIKIADKYRRNGYANEAITHLLLYFFNEFGGEKMIDTISANNLPGQTLLLNYGFKQKNQPDKKIILVEMTKKDFSDLYMK